MSGGWGGSLLGPRKRNDCRCSGVGVPVTKLYNQVEKLQLLALSYTAFTDPSQVSNCCCLPEAG